MARRGRRPNMVKQEVVQRDAPAETPIDLINQAQTALEKLYKICRNNGDTGNAGAVASVEGRVISLKSRFSESIIAPGETVTIDLNE